MADEQQSEILRQGARVWNEWIKNHSEEVDLYQANLCGADLQGAYLLRANLIEAKLGGANLADAYLVGADLSRADLSGAMLRGSCLYAADLIATNLESADLTKANLVSTYLQEPKMAGAVLAEGAFGKTKFCFVTLKEVSGLETCEHHAPSALDYFTLSESGPLPERFLRGCGLSDEFIHFLPSFWNEPFHFYSCFISYSHADKAFARRLYDALQGRGIRCWLDEHQLLPGDQIHRHVDEAIRLWDKVLLCCSKTALESWWVDKEIQKALMKEEQLWKERGHETLAIIPLDLDGHLFSDEWKAKRDWKEQHLITRLAADFTGWKNDDDKFNEQLERVIKALRADGGARQTPPKPRL